MGLDSRIWVCYDGQAVNLKKIIEIINSDLEEFDKAYQLYGLYNSAEHFRSSYSVIYKRGREDELFKGNIEYFKYTP